MKHLDAESAINAGGWDPRFAVTLAVAEHDDIAAALIDTNGDEADIDLDQYERDADGNWQAFVSGNVDDEGASWSSLMVATWGRTTPGRIVEIDYLDQRHSTVARESGWWVFIAPSTPESDVLPRRVDPR